MSQHREPIRILHVDDGADFAETAAVFLEREDDRFDVETATSAREGWERLVAADGAFDCVVSDFDMPDRSGIAFLEDVRERYPDLPFILFTGKGSEEVASDAISAGVTDYLQKEGGTDQYTILANRIENAVAAHRSATEAEGTRRHLEQILKTVPACVVRLDRDGRFVYANDRAVDVLGLEQSDLTDRTYNDPAWRIRDLDGEPIPDEELPFRQVRDSGEPLYGFRHTIEWPDGTWKILLVNGAPLFAADGTVESVVFSLSDVTEQVEREEHLRRTTARLEALFENSPDMINVHDAEGNIIDPNPRLCEETGYDEATLTDMKVWELDETIDPEAATDVWSAMETGDRRELEGVYRRRDGSTFPAEIHVRRLDLDGEDRFVVISRNVADRAARERELERYEAIVENTEDGIYVFDGDARFEFVNRRVVDVTRIPRDEWIGAHVSALADTGTLTAEEVAAIEEGIEAIVDGEQTEVRTELRPDVPTDLGVLELRLTSFGTDDGDDRVIGFTRDVTDSTRRQEELERQNERLEEFAGVVSHDLRNPLNVAEGRLELARADSDLSHLKDVANAHERMRDLIEDILALAREGSPVEAVEPVALGELVERCWRTVETGDASLVVDTERRIRADPDRLRQLLENLVGNAVEHGGPGVTVTVGDLADGFYVADDGPGIPPGERADVFESGYSTTETGAGFGLAIANGIAEAHGWEIGVTDSEAGGARFEITGVAFVDP